MYGGKHHLFEGLERPPRRPSTTEAKSQARQPSAVSYPAARSSGLPERNVREHAQSLRNYSATATASFTPKPYRTNSEPVNPPSTYPDPQTLHSYGPYIAPLNDHADPNSLSRANFPQPLGTEYPYLQSGPSSGARDSSYEDAPQPNSHHYSAEPVQYPPLRSTEYNGNAGNSAYPAQPSNPLHNLGNEKSRDYGANKPSTMNQTQGPAWNNDGYRGPLAQSRWNFDSSRPGGPRQMSEVLVSPRSSGQESDYSPQGRESAHQDEYAAKETIYDEYHSANTLPIVPSSAEQGGCLDPDQNLSSMQLAPQNTRYSDGTWEEGYSSACRDTTSSDSVSWKDRTSFSSVSDDYKANPMDLPSKNAIPTGINLARSCQNCKEFQCDVNVWQDDQRRNSRFKEQLKFITLLFDTQCQGSNWVAQKIVDELGATVEEFSPPAEFIGFNGYPMITSQKTSLSFKNSSGGSRYKATFLVSAVEEVPFDMLLGADDCLMLKIIGPPTLLGLAGPVESKGDKQANAVAAERHAEEKRRVEHEAQKKRDKKKKEEERKGEHRSERRWSRR